MEVSGQLHAPAALPSRKVPPVPSEYKAGWAQSQSGLCREEKTFFPLPEIKTRTSSPSMSIIRYCKVHKFSATGSISNLG
jgi:hypothetical protein